jgi:hypothetical protein
MVGDPTGSVCKVERAGPSVPLLAQAVEVPQAHSTRPLPVRGVLRSPPQDLLV